MVFVEEPIHVILETARGDVMVEIHQRILDVPDSDVDPGKLFLNLVRLDDLMDVLFHK